MTKILIPFYSRTGTIERLALGVAEGAKSEGAEMRLRRAREVAAMNARYPAPTAEDAVWADGVILGSPTRFGAICSELKAFIDGLGGLWAKGALNGKAGSAFAGSSQMHGGNESTVLSM